MFTGSCCGKPHSRKLSSIRQWPNLITDHVRSFTELQRTSHASISGSTSMIKRIAAITFIFLCAAFAWGILGATIFQRTYSSDTSSESRVASTWGAPQNQAPPVASFEELVPKKEVSTENGKKIELVTQEKVIRPLPL